MHEMEPWSTEIFLPLGARSLFKCSVGTQSLRSLRDLLDIFSLFTIDKLIN